MTEGGLTPSNGDPAHPSRVGASWSAGTSDTTGRPRATGPLEAVGGYTRDPRPPVGTPAALHSLRRTQPDGPAGHRSATTGRRVDVLLVHVAQRTRAQAHCWRNPRRKRWFRVVARHCMSVRRSLQKSSPARADASTATDAFRPAEDTAVTNDDRSDVAQRPLDSPPTDAVRRPRREPDSVEEASMESFPASDPPTWSSMRAGPPRT